MFCDLSSIPLEFKWKEKRLVLQQQQLKVMATINEFVSIWLCQLLPCELLIKTRVGAMVALGKY